VTSRIVRNIVIKGTSGSGKSTLAANLSNRFDLTWIELDALFHGPHWSQPSPEDFRARVTDAMANARNGWVVDGNYDSWLDEMVIAAADMIVWLDLPLRVKLWHIANRSRYRIRNNIELWNGNRESWREQLTRRDSIFIEAITRHRRHRKQWPARFANDDRLVRLRSERDVHRWRDEIDIPMGKSLRRPCRVGP
jgi:adenylate kinase family enzyme